MQNSRATEINRVVYSFLAQKGVVDFPIISSLFLTLTDFLSFSSILTCASWSRFTGIIFSDLLAVFTPWNSEESFF